MEVMEVMEVKLQSGQSTLCAGNFSIAAAQIRYLGFSKRPTPDTDLDRQNPYFHLR